ncbi:MAG: type I restriction enzyme HsdR N-terminal domain-containing protein [Deltaproteobacteria bacterium]|nr:type I restriction enzyme HsdR N-terminal domain-containing protein [Deltaproteobacteria bacterium]MBW2070126.1 type I restriction enzyme HsdR N-terminal domain-containing protein [Deltaproteobacteria bacterium]
MGAPLILGELVDFITGRTITDTLDERYRQRIAKILVEEKGYLKEDIQIQRELPLLVDASSYLCKIDFAVVLNGKTVMIVRFGPGSIVSRERPALAAARLLEPYTVPFAVVTNGKEAHLIDTASGRVIGRSLDSIPSRSDLLDRFPNILFTCLAEKRLEKERRILFAFEAIGTCPLDSEH